MAAAPAAAAMGMAVFMGTAAPLEGAPEAPVAEAAPERAAEAPDERAALAEELGAVSEA